MDTKIIDSLLKKLKIAYPEPKIELKYSNPFQLLIATILSAQCTDKRVNEVTKNLFQKLKTPEDFQKIPVEELELMIKSTGFYKNKAKNIKACCKILSEKFKGEIPVDIEKLSKLPGVGRKTANVILVECFKIPGIVVDTHVKRFSLRFGLTNYSDPVKIEFDLMKKLPKDNWIFFSKAAVLHGRYICKSRKADCNNCILDDICLKLINKK